VRRVAGRGLEVLVCDDAEEVAQVVAERLVAAARHGASVVLTGGMSPKRAYELAARAEPDWSRATIWWGDERCVDPDDERSNYRLAKETLLDGLERPPAVVHRMRGELGKDAGADAYAEELGSTALDLVLLGLGPDGHVASLFPNEPSLDEDERRAIGTEAKLEPFVDRISLTVPALRAASAVVFVVTGGEKADAVARAFAGEATHATPGSLVRAETGETVAVVDEAAAARLSVRRRA
jgi:6-phosphogluconolactonase